VIKKSQHAEVKPKRTGGRKVREKPKKKGNNQKTTLPKPSRGETEGKKTKVLLLKKARVKS